MRTIHLHGRLKKQFGATHQFAVETAGEALRALNCAFPGDFVGALQEGAFKVVRGDRFKGMHLDINLVNELRLGSADLHILPVAQGASQSGKGTTKAILGSVLIGGAIFMSGGTLAAPLAGMGSTAFGIGGMAITWGNIAMIGLGLTLAGASSLLAKPSEASDTKKDESFMIHGPRQTGQQGSAIPLIFGRDVLASPVLISIDSDIENIGTYQGQLPGPLDAARLIFH